MDLIPQINFKAKLKIIASLIKNVVHDDYSPGRSIFLIKKYLKPWEIDISEGKWFTHQRRNLKKNGISK